MKTLLLLGVLGTAMLFAAPADPKKDAARKEATRVEAKSATKPEAKPSAEVKAAPRTGEAPKSGVKGTDAFGRTQTRYDNGVTAVTTRFSNGVTATTRPDPFGGSTTSYSDGTRATTRTDPFGNQVTTYSDGRRETIRPDPFSSAPAKKDGSKERK